MGNETKLQMYWQWSVEVVDTETGEGGDWG